MDRLGNQSQHVEGTKQQTNALTFLSLEGEISNKQIHFNSTDSRNPKGRKIPGD